MRRSRMLAGTAAAILGGGLGRANAAADSGHAGGRVRGSVRGTIVLVSGRLPRALQRTVGVSASDVVGDPVGRVAYRADGNALHYAVTDLPLGVTLTVELHLLHDGEATPDRIVPTLARSDYSYPLYAFVIPYGSPVRAPLDFRVSVMTDPAPAGVER